MRLRFERMMILTLPRSLLLKKTSDAKLVLIREAQRRKQNLVDNIYQSIKAFLKSFINLLLAIVDLITSLINGLASILVRLRPRISQKYTELKGERELREKGTGLRAKGREEILVEKIRNELSRQTISRERYYYLSACVSNDSFGFYAVVISVLFFVLLGSAMLFGRSNFWEVRIAGVLLMAAFCIAACVVIAAHQRKILKNKLMRRILEEEFADQLRGQEDAPMKHQPEQRADDDNETEKSGDGGDENLSVVNFNLLPSESADNPCRNSSFRPR